MVDLRQQRGAALDPLSAGPLIAPILGRPFSHRRTIPSRHAVEPGLALLAASQNPRLMQFALGAPAIGFAALATEPIERSGDHRGGPDQFSENTAQDGKGTAELLPELGELRASHLYLLHIYNIQTSSQKTVRKSKSDQKCSLPQKSRY
jgi:hypothetical protein